jgi:CHAT domain-containing protein
MKVLTILIFAFFVLGKSELSAAQTDFSGNGLCPLASIYRDLREKSEFEAFMVIKHIYGYVAQYSDVDMASQFEDSRDALGEVYNRYLVNRLRELSRRTPTYALIYESPVDNQTDACVWLVGPEGIISIGRYEASPQAVSFFVSQINIDDQLAKRVGRKLESGDRCDPNPEANTRSLQDDRSVPLEKLSAKLLPAEIAISLEWLNGRLLILPAQNLSTVPFSALPLGGGSLVDNFALLMIEDPSDLVSEFALELKFPERTDKLSKRDLAVKTILARNLLTRDYAGGVDVDADPDKRAKPPSVNTLVVGNPSLSMHKNMCWPNLPSAESEAREVAEKWNSKNLLIGKNATYKKVVSVINKSNLDILYFATHAMSDAVNPADEGYLALAGKYLTGRDLRNIKLKNNPLVVLSACQTGLGKEISGGIFGLTRIWLYRGASQVVSSLWNVDDRGTSKLMTEFVEALGDPQNIRQRFRRGFGAEYALQKAVLETRELYPDPAVWGAFLVVGHPSE